MLRWGWHVVAYLCLTDGVTDFMARLSNIDLVVVMAVVVVVVEVVAMMSYDHIVRRLHIMRTEGRPTSSLGISKHVVVDDGGASKWV